MALSQLTPVCVPGRGGLMKHSITIEAHRVFRMGLCIAVLTTIAALGFPPMAAAATQATISEPAASSDKGGPTTVLATVGARTVTQGEVDNKVATQLYDLRKQALDDIIDGYVLQQAATRAGLKPDQYVD